MVGNFWDRVWEIQSGCFGFYLGSHWKSGSNSLMEMVIFYPSFKKWVNPINYALSLLWKVWVLIYLIMLSQVDGLEMLLMFEVVCVCHRGLRGSTSKSRRFCLWGLLFWLLSEMNHGKFAGLLLVFGYGLYCCLIEFTCLVWIGSIRLRCSLELLQLENVL